ncbi:hypothetical protein [Sinorhizobium fredii]|uniref:hypothetical protein n=1 Tax=Rhizobium fredii TaxID=380 RepID=UPI0012FE2115|nr:hypothetical protein [Sinorhizobium fredii]
MRRFQGRVAALVVTLCATSATAAAEDCELFSKVFQASRSGFSELQGAYDSDLDEYTATLFLPGATRCYINGAVDSDYACEWRYAANEKADVEAAMAEVVASVRACVPENALKSVQEIPETHEGWSDKVRVTLKDRRTILVYYQFHKNKRKPERSTYALRMRMQGKY